MPNLTFFSSDAVDQLALSLNRAESIDEFMGSISSIAARAEFIHDLDWEFRSDTPVLPDDDGKAAVLIYEWLGPMPPVQAADPRLWTFLSLVTFRDYSMARWPLITKEWKNRVRDRWLMRTGNRRDLVRNSIARLWWAAHFTHDFTLNRPLTSKYSDPYRYTMLLLGNQDRFVAIMERDIGMIQHLVFAILEHIDSDARFQTGSYAKDLMKELTLVAGYKELSFVDNQYLQEIVAEAASRVRVSRPKISGRSSSLQAAAVS